MFSHLLAFKPTNSDQTVALVSRFYDLQPPPAATHTLEKVLLAISPSWPLFISNLFNINYFLEVGKKILRLVGIKILQIMYTFTLKKNLYIYLFLNTTETLLRL